MGNELLLVNHQFEQRLVGMDVRVLYPLVESDISTKRAYHSLCLIDNNHIRLIRLIGLLHFYPAFPDDIEILPSKEGLVFPWL